MQTFTDKSIQRVCQMLSRVKGGTRVARALCRFRRRLSPRDLIARLPNNLLMRCNTDSELQWSLFLRGIFEKEVYEYVHSVLEPDAVFFDVGANVGCYTLQAAGLVGPKGKVCSFEPDPDVFDTLKSNIALNELSQVQAMNLALGNDQGTIPFYRTPPCPFANALGSVHPSVWHKDGDRLDVKIDRLDDVVAQLGITRLDLMKIDVEGAEYEVIAGAERTLRLHRSRLIMEINLHTCQVSGWKPSQMAQRLRDLGYRIHRLNYSGLLEPVPADLDGSSFTLVATAE